MAQESDLLEPIAVVGFSLKFPGDASTPEGFWRMLQDKQCAFQNWPQDRMNIEAFLNPDAKGFIQGAHFVKEDHGLFDASFFGISGTEACAMDPQNRILLEAAYRALENSGIPMEKARGSKTAVYTGSMSNDYTNLITRDPDLVPRYTAVGTGFTMLSNRLSWFFNFHGPSFTVDSACSGSLVALDLACQGLRNGDSEMALVCGSSIILAAEPMLQLTNMSFCSPDGRSFSFDSRANGYGRGEGMSVVLIKRLSDAIRDGNIIRAVIRSTGSNQDGYTPGITQPSQEAQARLIRETYEKAGLDFSLTRYIEAHGTGTAIGDPIEASAIGSVFGDYRSPSEPLYVGAVKTNIGHLEGGSGLAGLIKAVMVLEKGLIPPNTNFENLNPDIDAEFLNLKFPTEMTPWPTDGLRRASVASFGFGGSNAHAVLDDAFNFMYRRSLTGLTSSIRLSLPSPTTESIPENKPASHVLVWSTEDEAGVGRMIDAYTEYFGSVAHDITPANDVALLSQIASTLSTKRSQLKWRSFAVVDSIADGAKDLKSLISTPVRAGTASNAGYIFTGQGAQYVGMGIELLSYPVFRQTMKRCDNALGDLGCQWSLLELFASSPNELTDLNDPQYAQPMTTTLQIALVDLLTSLGLEPSIVVGHSSGEIAAAYSANGLDLVSACKIAYYRGKYASLLKKTSTKGAMLALDLSETEAQAHLARHRESTGVEDVFVACINSPSNVTLSGREESIHQLKSTFELQGLVSHLLKTGVAYHTPQMNEVAKDYGNACTSLTRPETSRKGKTIMVSSVTGEEIKDIGILSTAAYWVENMTKPVRFSSAMGHALSRSRGPQKHKKLGASRQVNISDWVEVGPHSALRGPFRTISQVDPTQKKRYGSVLRRGYSSIRTFQTTLATLYSHGHSIKLDQLNQSEPAASGFEQLLVKLPEYPFNHTKRYWFESQLSQNLRLRKHKKLELLGVPALDSTAEEPRWRKFFDTTEAPWLLDHVAGHKPVYPAVGMIIMALEGVKQLADPSRQISGYFVHDATFMHPISISTLSRTEAQLHMRPTRHMVDHSSTYEFQVYTNVGERREVACKGSISLQYVTRGATNHGAISGRHEAQEKAFYIQQYEEETLGNLQHVSKKAFYECLNEMGAQYGPSFQGLDKIRWNGSNVAISEVTPFAWTKEQSSISPEPHVFHPVTLDSLIQLGFASTTKGGTTPFTTGMFVSRIRNAWISASGAPGEVLKGYAKADFKGLRGSETSAFALDSSNEVRVFISSVETTSLTVNCPRYQAVEPRQLCFSLKWESDSSINPDTAVALQPAMDGCVFYSLEGFVLLIQPESPFQAQLSASISTSLFSAYGLEVRTCSVYEVNKIPYIERSLAIFLPEMERPLLADMDQLLFLSLQTFFGNAREIIWATAGDRKSLLSPRLHIVDGLARVLCTENDQLTFITSHFEDHGKDPSLWVNHILSIVRKRVSQSVDDPIRELDYHEWNGTLHVARVQEDEALNETLLDMTQAPAKMRAFGEISKPLTRAVVQPGFLDVENSVFVEDADYGNTEIPLQPHEVEIEIKAVGVNLRDVFVQLGKITDERQLGCECAGVVRRVGSAAEVKTGDRVMACLLGTHRNLVKCHTDAVVKIPDRISWAVAAAVPLVGITAYYALVKIARLQRGESILIHAGAGGTGQTAIQMALNIGAKVYTTVSSEEKRALIQECYGLPDDQILFSRDTSFQRHIMRLTGGLGVDVVLNSLSGDGLVASWGCIAAYGRFVEIGKSDIQANSNLPMIYAANNVSFSVLAVDEMSRHRVDLMKAGLRPVMEMVAAGTLKPACPLHEYSIEQTSEAFRLMQSGRNMGKAVIHMNLEAKVPMAIRTTTTNRFPADATYMIAGGLGGLGRSAARWMVSMGARYLILLSRSGAVTSASQALIQELTDKGVRVSTPKCDVTSLDALSTAFKECSDWPPVRGCIQGTMVLQDTIFEKQTFHQWTTTLRSKVLGTENLHALLPADLDFFICLSSLSGVIGNISQANYAAGNTFQDAFTSFRREIGQKAVALDFGWMAEVGVAAENEKYTKIQQRVPGMAQVSQAEFHALLERYCGLANSPQPEPSTRSSDNSLGAHQVIVGLLTPAQLQAQGIDPPHWLLNRGIFKGLPQNATDIKASTSTQPTGDTDLQNAFRKADSAAAAIALVTEGLVQKLARALGVAVGEVDLQRPLALQGVDSLLAVELRHWLQRLFTAEVSAIDITSAGSVDDLAMMVMQRVSFDHKWSE